MDELEFQRRAYAEPNCQDEGFLQHTKQSSCKQPLLNELIQMDSMLVSALNIMPPPGLMSQIEFKQSLLSHRLLHKQRVKAAVITGVVVCSLILLIFFTRIF